MSLFFFTNFCPSHQETFSIAILSFQTLPRLKLRIKPDLKLFATYTDSKRYEVFLIPSIATLASYFSVYFQLIHAHKDSDKFLAIG